MFLFIRMALYAAFGTLAGQGFEFIVFDQQTGQVDISFNVDSLAQIVIGALGFVGTFGLSLWDGEHGPVKHFKGEEGGVAVKAALSMVLALVFTAGCADPQSAARLAAIAACSSNASVQGLSPGSQAWNISVASCVSAQLTNIIIEDRLITDDDSRAGGGKL